MKSQVFYVSHWYTHCREKTVPALSHSLSKQTAGRTGKEGHGEVKGLSEGPTRAEQEQVTASPSPAGLSAVISAVGAHQLSPPCRLSAVDIISGTIWEMMVQSKKHCWGRDAGLPACMGKHSTPEGNWMKPFHMKEKTFPSDPVETRTCLWLTPPQQQDHPWLPSCCAHTTEGLNRCPSQGHALLQPTQDPLRLLAHGLLLASGEKNSKTGLKLSTWGKHLFSSIPKVLWLYSGRRRLLLTCEPPSVWFIVGNSAFKSKG